MTGLLNCACRTDMRKALIAKSDMLQLAHPISVATFVICLHLSCLNPCPILVDHAQPVDKLSR